MSELLLIALTAAIVSNFWLDRAGRETSREIGPTLVLGAAVWLTLAAAVAVETVAVRTALAPHAWAHFAPLVSLLASVGGALVAAHLPLRATAALRSQTWLVAADAALLALAVRHAADTRGTALVSGVVGAGAAFCAAFVLLDGITERLDRADVPERLRGPAVRLVAAALLSLAFMGFSGVAGL
jgi:electron transport complex protein RnfA